jgi:8-oxo-dGTP pyrophosphatase MutT (NUDIX family)
MQKDGINQEASKFDLIKTTKIYKNLPPNLNVLLLKTQESEGIIETFVQNFFNVYLTNTYNDAIELFSQKGKDFFPIVVTALGKKKDLSDHCEPLIKKVRQLSTTTFIIIFSLTAVNDPKIRKKVSDEGSNMVTACIQSLEVVTNRIYANLSSNIKHGDANLTCPICGMENLNEDALWIHLPLYHINYDANLMKKIKLCPLCNKYPDPNLQVHYRNLHGPGGRGEVHSDYSKPVSLYAFALVVVYRKLDKKYLLVQEFANSGFWLPGGRVDSGENLKDAAIRETKEEAGIDIKLTGILTVQFNHSHGRFRIIYFAEPIDDTQLPKSIPDYESMGASYASWEDIKNYLLPLRGNEPLEWINYVEQKKEIFPLTFFSKE